MAADGYIDCIAFTKMKKGVDGLPHSNSFSFIVQFFTIGAYRFSACPRLLIMLRNFTARSAASVIVVTVFGDGVPR
jgi:hypothetical protein